MAEITFGPFTVDIPGARLLRDGAEIKLRPQAFQALRVLLFHGGQTVPYEQMIAEAWDGTFVSRHTVDVTVGEVRRSLQEFGSWITNRPKVGHRLDIPKSDVLVRKGWHFWNRRTREGFEHAIDCFGQAAEECSADFRAFEGLSITYLMLATYGMRPPREMYPAFLDAHEKAVARGGLTPELRCNRAHGLHMFEGRLAEAESELNEALREKPTLASIYVRKAMVHVTQGRLDEALDVIAQAHRADPLLPTVPMVEIVVRLSGGDLEGAMAIGAKTVELHPYLQRVRALYAQALEFSGRLEEALTQYQIGSAMSPDLPWLRALEGTCLAKLQRPREAQAILDQLLALRQSTYVDAYFMAPLREILGQRDEALVELQRAFEENSAWWYSFDFDPKMRSFKGDPRFERICRERKTRLRGSKASHAAERNESRT